MLVRLLQPSLSRAKWRRRQLQDSQVLVSTCIVSRCSVAVDVNNNTTQNGKQWMLSICLWPCSTTMGELQGRMQGHGEQGQNSAIARAKPPDRLAAGCITIQGMIVIAGTKSQR